LSTIGCVGSPWRATVTSGGDIEPWDGTAALRWHVAADDRWHTPANEPSTRQRLIDGTPVVETRVRIPGGDAVQRIYATTHRGGMTVIQVTNESSLPIAVAFTRADLLSARPPADVPIQGIDLPVGSVTFPIGHAATATWAIAHHRPAGGLLPADLPTAEQVVHGWLSTCERASRLTLPDQSLVESVTAARCAALLEPLPSPDEEPAMFLVTLAQLVRMGEPTDPWLADVAAATERVFRKGSGSWVDHAAVGAARQILSIAGEQRAIGDLDRAEARWKPSARGDQTPAALGDISVVPMVEQMLADRHGALLPGGLARNWAGVNFDVHGLPIDTPTGLGSVSYAIRWHGARPAVLWETTGSAALSSPTLAPDWATAEPAGEALWPEYVIETTS